MENEKGSSPSVKIIPPEGEYLTPINKRYNSPTPGEITIVASTPNIGDKAPSDELCAELASCGFNSVIMSVTLSEVSQALASCGSHGIRPFLSHSHLLRDEQSCAEYVDMFRNNPNLGGWNLKGEPTYDELNASDGFSKFYNIISKHDPNHCIFVSLVGGPVSSYMNGHTYKEYIELFQDVLSPSFFPYVFYPVSGSDSNPTVDYETFFNDLEIYSLMAKYTERPFWAYVRCQSLNTHNASIRPTPTEGQLRFAVFSALAYGAQGLVYWAYRQSENSNNTIYQNAPVDRNGRKTAIWDYVQKINTEVKVLNDVFCGTDFIECRHTGDTQYRSVYSYALTGKFGPCESVKCYGKGALVSMLNNKGRNYLMIVNHDPESKQQINIRFNEYWKIRQLIIFQDSVNYTSIFKTLTTTIPPGSYLIFTWD